GFFDALFGLEGFVAGFLTTFFSSLVAERLVVDLVGCLEDFVLRAFEAADLTTFLETLLVGSEAGVFLFFPALPGASAARAFFGNRRERALFKLVVSAPPVTTRRDFADLAGDFRAVFFFSSHDALFPFPDAEERD